MVVFVYLVRLKMSKVAWISIKVTLKDDADLDEVAHNMDYNLEHDDIVHTEVMEIIGG